MLLSNLGPSNTARQEMEGIQEEDSKLEVSHLKDDSELPILKQSVSKPLSDVQQE